eukprot:CAMPEP_0117495012 /NCGR_PEP_ID=MMETSP0784-20121206/19913_1 /TAXON_ID=39447 /ORGANISM="" /LENGTH=921 /DNA_ID=CAMNT_0005289921 /DNA_START=152 /DNA_END=2917 /DNA_ORIENTATION=+
MNGPVKNRRCTDAYCIILFFLHWLVYLVIIFQGFSDGNPRKLFAPRDYQGAYCSVEEQWNNGPNLQDHPKLIYTMNVSYVVSDTVKQMMCSSVVDTYLQGKLTGDEYNQYLCDCCKTPCSSCLGSLDIEDVDTAVSLESVITAKMKALVTGSSDLFTPDGVNGDLFTKVFYSATQYFIKTCITDCAAITTEPSRTYTFEPAPDDGFAKPWHLLRNESDVPAEIQNTIATSFTFQALGFDICPYANSKCVPFPGVEFTELAGRCMFHLGAKAVDEVGGFAANAMESFASTDFATTSTETFGTWLGEVEECKLGIILTCIMSFLIGLVFIVLLRFFVGCVVYTSIFFVSLLLVMGGSLCLVRSGQCAGVGFFESGQQNLEAVTGTAQNLATDLVASRENFDLQGALDGEAYTGAGQDYRGVQDHTISGKKCQAWSAQSPHAHTKYTPESHPDSALESNYCRNPTQTDAASGIEEVYTMWCYTEDTTKRWEVCVPFGVLNAACVNGYEVSGESARKAIEICGYVLWGLALLWLIVIWCICSRIRVAIALNKVAAQFIFETPQIFAVPIIQTFCGIVWGIGWALSATFMISQVSVGAVSTDAYATYADGHGRYEGDTWVVGPCLGKWPQGFTYRDDDNCDMSTNVTKCWRCAPPRFAFDDYRFLYSVFSYFWNNAFLIAFGQCIIAGAVGIWFFTTHNEKRGASKLGAAWWNTIRYHSGSLAFGSFILAIVQFVRYLMMYFERQAKAQKNYVGQILLKVGICITWCLEKCIKFLNKNAYIQVALMGTNFCTSAKVAYSLILRNFIRLGVLAGLGYVVQMVGVAFITAMTGVIGYFLLKGLHSESNPVVPIIVVSISGYVVGRLYMSVFELCVDTSLQCFLICEEYGEPVEDFAPKPLQNLLPRLSKGKSEVAVDEGENEAEGNAK